MSHNPRINSDSFYVNGVNIPTAYFQALDTAQFKSINGDFGGTWNPGSAPLTIAGSGMWCTGAWTLNGARDAVTPSGSGVRFVHGDNDYFVLKSGHTGSSRGIVTPIGAHFVDVSGAILQTTSTITPPGKVLYNGLGNLGSSNVIGAQTYALNGGARFIVPIRVHHGSVISQAQLFFNVGQSHSGVPTSLPRMRLYQVDGAGNVTPATGNTAFDASGFLAFDSLVARPGTGAAWYNSGNVQSIVYSCGWGAPLSGVTDTSTYSYFLDVIDEFGTNALSGNNFHSLLCTFQVITDMRFQ